MNNGETIKWLESLKAEIGKAEHRTLWHYAEAIDMAIETLQAEPVKHSEWKLDPNGMDWNIPAWRCSECGFVANYIGVEVNGLGNNPMNWAGSNYCPNCGADMRGDIE